MKTFLVYYQFCDCFSCNMIWANTGAHEQEAVQETAERHASKYGYTVSSIRELADHEVNSNLRRGMPYYSIDDEAEEKYDPSFSPT